MAAATSVLPAVALKRRVRIVPLELGDVTFHDLADRFAGEPEFALLDSRTNDGGLGQFSLFSFAPFAKLTSKNGVSRVSEHGSTRVEMGVFPSLDRMLSQYQVEAEHNAAGLPFLGGAIGYFSYELGRQIEKLPNSTDDQLGLPDCYLSFYNFAVVQCHADNRLYFCHFDATAHPTAAKADDVLAKLGSAKRGAYRRGLRGPKAVAGNHRQFQTDFTKDEYCAAIARIRDYIRAGDVYQVNMTQRIQASVADVPPWRLYQCLMEVNPAPFAAYLNCEGHAIVSSSPERFLLVRGQYVETRPIKGTIRRGATPREDYAKGQELLRSGKNRAELAMIVDLMRNDLGRVCTPGSVRVKAFPELETYSSVHHLVATIQGERRRDRTLTDLIRATFPGGSITGAPKIRAMEIIDELEPVARGVYTGSIGYLGFNGSADLNIAIRTIIVKDGIAYVHAGGGIVAESEEVDEYEEALLKGRRLVDAINAV